MCLIASTGIELWVRDVHVVIAELTAGSSAALMDSERIAFWSGSVAEDASMHALLTPRPPICTGKLACDHCLSESSTSRTRDSPRLRVSSKDANKGLSKHGEVL